MEEPELTILKDKIDEQGTWVMLGMAAFFFLVVVIGVITIYLLDRINAEDAYRMTEYRNQRNTQNLTCLENMTSLKVLQEWIRQDPKLKPPPMAMVAKDCPPIQPIEQEK